MKHLLKCLVAGTLLLSCLVGMIGCGEKMLDDATAIARAKELLPHTTEIDRLLYVEGIPLLADGKEEGGYYPADMTALSEMGIYSTEDILAKMEGVWSPAYITRIRSSSLFSSVNAGVAPTLKYCYDRYNAKTGVYEGIWVNAEGLPQRTDPTEFLTETLAVKEKTELRVKLTLLVRVTSREDPTRTQEKQISITLSREEKSDVWLLESPTAVKFFEPQD